MNVLSEGVGERSEEKSGSGETGEKLEGRQQGLDLMKTSHEYMKFSITSKCIYQVQYIQYPFIDF